MVGSRSGHVAFPVLLLAVELVLAATAVLDHQESLQGIPSLVFAANTTQIWINEYPGASTTTTPVSLPPRMAPVAGLRLRPVGTTCLSAGSPDVVVGYSYLDFDGQIIDRSWPLCRRQDPGFSLVARGLSNLSIHVGVPGTSSVTLKLSLRYEDAHRIQPGFMPVPEPTSRTPVTMPQGSLRAVSLLADARVFHLAWITSLGVYDSFRAEESNNKLVPGPVVWQRGSQGLEWIKTFADTAHHDQEEPCRRTDLPSPTDPRPWTLPSAQAQSRGQVDEPVPAGASSRRQCDLWTETVAGTDWQWCFVGGQVYNVKASVAGTVKEWLQLHYDLDEMVATPMRVCARPDCSSVSAGANVMVDSSSKIQCGPWGVPSQDYSSCDCITPDVSDTTCSTVVRGCPCASPSHGFCPFAPSLLDGTSCRCTHHDQQRGHACDQPRCAQHDTVPLPRVNICDASTSPPQLACAPGWTGVDCMTSMCADSCRDNQVCGNDGKCVCRPLYVDPGDGSCTDPPSSQVWTLGNGTAAGSAMMTPVYQWTAGHSEPVTLLVRVPPAVLQGAKDPIVLRGDNPVGVNAAVDICFAWDRIPDPLLGDCRGINHAAGPDLMPLRDVGAEFYLSIHPPVPLLDPVDLAVRVPLSPSPSPHSSGTLLSYRLLAIAGGGVVVVAGCVGALIRCLRRRQADGSDSEEGIVSKAEHREWKRKASQAARRAGISRGRGGGLAWRDDLQDASLPLLHGEPVDVDYRHDHHYDDGDEAPTDALSALAIRPSQRQSSPNLSQTAQRPRRQSSPGVSSAASVVSGGMPSAYRPASQRRLRRSISAARAIKPRVVVVRPPSPLPDPSPTPSLVSVPGSEASAAGGVDLSELPRTPRDDRGDEILDDF